MTRKFVLLSAARSGTSLVTETLATHPDVLVHGEIFHERVDWHIHPEFAAVNDLSKRERQPVGFARDILSQNFGREVVGFKMWQSQSVAACDDVLGDPSIIKVVLERENRLAHMASRILAEESDVWNVRRKDRLDVHLRDRKICFSEEQFLQFVDFHDKLFAYYRLQAVGRVINVTYKDACRLHLDAVLAEFGLAPAQFETQTHKLYGSDILGRFEQSQHLLIREALARLGRPEWLREDI
jgi:hypothetical protein